MSRNPYKRTVCGVGYLGVMSNGEVPKTVDETGKVTREYKVWNGMIARCYDGRERHKTYKNHTVWDRWHCYANFLEDMSKIMNYEYWKTHPHERITLDKDKYYEENGIQTDSKEYSLLTVRFISQSENTKEMAERTRKKQIKATNIKTGEVIYFDSIRQASEMIQSKGTSHTREKKIGDCCRGLYKTKYGYTWEFLKE